MSVNVISLSEGAEGVYISNTRFNTTLISFNFYLPTNKDEAAANALLPFLLTTCGEKYPDFSRLNYKLSKLYGAQLEASAEKLGDYQLLKISISIVDDRFTLDNEPLTEQAIELLLSLIFSPKAENGEFCSEDVEREKRKAAEHIRSEMSEKRTYAKNRLNEEMYKGKAYGVPKCGTESNVLSLDGKILYNAWKKMIETAYIRINVISRSLPSRLFDTVRERLEAVSRHDVITELIHEPTRKISTPHTVTETMDVAQGKLVMGFSSRSHGSDDTTLPLLIMGDMFGGGPYSRLFSNVREKLSLCYYCSASTVRIKGLLTVESGVEAQNAEKTKEAVLEQLEIMKNGGFSDFELNSSIKSTSDSLRSYNDSQSALDTWYSIKISNQNLLTPEDVANEIAKIDRKAVIKAANGIYLHTVYQLMPKENGN